MRQPAQTVLDTGRSPARSRSRPPERPARSSRRKWWLGLLGSVAICEAVGIIGALTTDTGESPWYRSLRKPRFTPPSSVFGPVWTSLYALMGASLNELWQKRDDPHARQALSALGTQLLLNGSWTPVFFGLKSPEGGLVVILALWAELLLTIDRAGRVSRSAAALLTPYLAWVSFASVLNAYIVHLNAGREAGGLGSR